MPDRISDCACYDVFTVKDGEQIILAAVSDAQWTTFCHALGFTDMLSRPELATNNDRVRVRSTLLPELRARLANHSAAALSAIFEPNGLPFAPTVKPEELSHDPHLPDTGALADLRLTDGARTAPTT